MRKFAMLFGLAFGVLSVTAQQALTPASAGREGFKVNKEVPRPGKNSANKSAAFFNQWIDYQVAYETLYGQTASLVGNHLFPDSTGVVNYSTGPGSVWIHNATQVFDLGGQVISSSYTAPFDPAVGYTIDSLQAIVWYQRVNMSASQYDTLIVRVIAPGANNLNTGYYFNSTSGVSANLNPGGDVSFVDVAWDFATLSVPGVTQTYKIPMGDAFYADSTDGGLHVVNIAANLNIPAATDPDFQGLVAVSLAFKPGYTWTPNVDVLGEDINTLRFLSWELNGDDTYPIYTDGDFQCAHILPIDIRYELDPASSWNGSMIPAWAYMGSTPGYAYEDHTIFMKVSQTNNIGVVENDKVGFSVYPNPSQGTMNVRFEAEGTYTLSLMNILGQEVSRESVTVNAGDVVTRDYSSLDKGMYLLNVSNGRTTTVEKVTLR